MFSITESDCGVIVHATMKPRIVFSVVEPGAVVGMREGCCCCCCCCSARMVWLRWLRLQKQRLTMWEVLVARDGGMIVKWNRVPVTFGNLDGSDTPLRCGDGGCYD